MTRAGYVASLARSGPDYPSTMRVAQALASILQASGKVHEAEPLLRELVEARTRVHGEHHQRTLIAMSAYARTLRGLGRLEEAEAILTRVLEVAPIVMGETHTDTLVFRGHYAQLLRETDRDAEAAVLLEQVVDRLRSTLGNAHKTTRNLMDDLADVYHDLGRFEESISRYRILLEADREAGAPPTEITSSLAIIAAMLVAGERCAEAEPVIRECLEIRYRILDPDDWRLANLQNLLGACALAERRYDEAESLLVAAHEALRDHPDAPEARVTEALERVVRLYTELGRTDDAERYRAMLPAAQEALGSE